MSVKNCSKCFASQRIVIALLAMILVLPHALDAETLFEPEVVQLSGYDGTLTLFIGGDTHLGDAAKETLKAEGYDYPFRDLSNIIAEADFAIANLEAPICDDSDKLPHPKDYYYRMPSSVTDVFRQVGFDGFFLANNHAVDYSYEGLLETLAYLWQSGIKTLGAGVNEALSRRGVILKEGGVALGILNYMSYRKKYDVLYDFYAEEDEGGIAELNREDVQRDIKNLRKNGAKVVLVSVHWGDNYAPVDEQQRIEAEWLVEAGADIIVGHGSHDYQPIDILGDVPIFYSVGNLAFGTKGRFDFRYGFPVVLHFSENKLKKAEVIPLLTRNALVNYQPKVLRGIEAWEALNELKAESPLFPYHMTIENDRGVIRF